MKKYMLILLAAVFQMAQMPQAGAQVAEPWMSSHPALQSSASRFLDSFAGKKMTATSVLKEMEGKMDAKVYAQLAAKAAQAKASFEIRKESDTEISLVFDAKSFRIKAIDAANGDFNVNGRNVKIDFKKMEQSLKEMSEAMKFAKTSKVQTAMMLLLPQAHAFFTNEDGSANWGSILMTAGIAGLLIGGWWSASSRNSQYEQLANQCGMNGTYAGGNPYRFAKTVDSMNNSWGSWNPFNWFYGSDNKNAATACAWQAKQQMNQNYYANNPQTYGPGNFPRIAQQLTPTRYDAVKKQSQIRQQTIIYKGRTVPAAPISSPIEYSSSGQQ